MFAGKVNKRGQPRDDLVLSIKENFKKFPNNAQLASFLGIKLSTVRRFCYQLGLKRLRLEYFTIDQKEYLVNNYKAKGDVELAEIFQKKWPKQKGWTKKHMEKKRKYLSLHRTTSEVQAIHLRNVEAGRFKICPVKAWNKRGRSKEGEIRYWTTKQGTKYPVIKFKGKFIHWGRWQWETHFGAIRTDQNVVFKDGNPFNLIIENIELISNQELARRNSQKSSKGLSKNYVAGILSHGNPQLRDLIHQNENLIEIKRKQLILNRTIYESQRNNSST